LTMAMEEHLMDQAAEHGGTLVDKLLSGGKYVMYAAAGAAVAIGGYKLYERATRDKDGKTAGTTSVTVQKSEGGETKVGMTVQGVPTENLATKDELNKLSSEIKGIKDNMMDKGDLAALMAAVQASKVLVHTTPPINETGGDKKAL
jgi:hypothetical protein